MVSIDKVLTKTIITTIIMLLTFIKKTVGYVQILLKYVTDNIIYPCLALLINKIKEVYVTPYKSLNEKIENYVSVYGTNKVSTWVFIIEEFLIFWGPTIKQNLYDLAATPFRINTYFYINGSLWEYSKYGKYW